MKVPHLWLAACVFGCLSTLGATAPELEVLPRNPLLFGNASEQRLLVLARHGDGRLEDVTAEAGLTRRGWGQGVAVGDYDSDGALDFFLTGYASNALYRNRGDGTFEEVSVDAGIAPSPWSLGASFADIDKDGDLDLYVSNYLAYPLDRLPKRDANCNYRGFGVFCGPRGLTGLRDSLYLNDGSGRFRDVARERSIDDDRLYGLGVLVADYNNDSWPTT